MDRKHQTAPCGLDRFNCNLLEENLTDENKMLVSISTLIRYYFVEHFVC